MPYLDPEIASALVQFLIGAMVGAAVLVRGCWRHFKSVFSLWISAMATSDSDHPIIGKGLGVRVNRRFVAIGAGIAATSLLCGYMLLFSPMWVSNHAVQVEQFQSAALVDGIQNVLLPDPAVATRTDGVSFWSIQVVSKLAYSQFRVHIEVFASSDQTNDVVVAVFVNSDPHPVRIFTVPVYARKRTKLDDSFDFQGSIKRVNEFQFRIGPAHAGALTFNGPAESGQKLQSSVTILELRQ
jgi:hypothetical protein